MNSAVYKMLHIKTSVSLGKVQGHTSRKDLGSFIL